MSLPAGLIDPFANGFSEDAENSASLPAAFFTDPKVFACEKQRIFSRSWLLAGHINDIPAGGDSFTTSILDQIIVVTRTAAGDLDATLLPNRESIRVETLAGLVLINLDTNAISLAEQAQGLEDEIRAFAPGYESLVHAHRVRDVMHCNWKVAVENWSECYHCYTVHEPLANEFIDFSTFRIELNPLYQRQRMKLRENIITANPDVGDGEQASWTLLPNLGIQIVQGGYIMTSLWRPIDPDHCEFIEDWYLPNDKPTEQQRELFRFRAEHTQPEDVAVCEGLQRGLHSHGFERGRLMVDRQRTELSEHGSHHIQLWVTRMLMQD